MGPDDDTTDDETGPLPGSPFASASSMEASRIAETRRVGGYGRPGSLKSPASGQKAPRATVAQPAKKPGLKPASRAPQPANAKFKAKVGGLRQFDQRLDAKIAAIPQLQINAGNILRLRWLVGVQALAIVVLSIMAISMAAQRDEHDNYASFTAVPPATQAEAAVAQLGGNTSLSAGAAQQHTLLAMPAPTFTRQAVLSWAATTATEVMNFGFHNIGQRLVDEHHNFTSRGWDAFITAVTDSHIIERVTANQQVLTAAPVGAPVIVKVTDEPDGTHHWLVQMPFMITAISGKKTDPAKSNLTLNIVQVPPEDNLSGLSIDNWVQD